MAGALLEAGRKQDTRSHAEQRRLEAPGSRESGRHQQQLGEEVAVSRPPGSCGLKLRYSWRLSGGFEAVRAARCPLSFGGGVAAERSTRSHPDNANER